MNFKQAYSDRNNYYLIKIEILVLCVVNHGTDYSKS
jgi:hypothetical protein